MPHSGGYVIAIMHNFIYVLAHILFMVEKPPMVIKRLGIIADSKLAGSDFDELLRANPKEAAISYTYTLVKVPFCHFCKVFRKRD